MQYFCAIDPGAHGAIAFYNPADGHLVIEDMPTHVITKNGKKKTTIDLYQLGMLLDSWRPKVKHALVEQVSALPGQGVTSMFNFGFAAGCAQMVVAANLIPMTLVVPAVWKRAMGVSADKDSSRQKASMLLPQHAGQWTRVRDDGRAEAALLAWYGSKVVQ